jgi:hypothetical protein
MEGAEDGSRTMFLRIRVILYTVIRGPTTDKAVLQMRTADRGVKRMHSFV